MEYNFKFHLWPIWLLIANLLIAVRQTFPILPLLAVFAGTEKPNWKELKTNYFSPKNGHRKIITKQKEIVLKFKLLYLVTEMVVKARTLNQTQFVGKFGCIFSRNGGPNEKKLPKLSLSSQRRNAVAVTLQLLEWCTGVNENEKYLQATHLWEKISPNFPYSSPHIIVLQIFVRMSAISWKLL